MNFVQQIVFGPFKLDIVNEQLWRSDQQLSLRPQAFALLRYLSENSNRLISKDELLREVWQGRYVSASTIRGCIREIRSVLQDSAEASRYIETVGRKGYRFIGHQRDPSDPVLTLDNGSERLIVGRNDEFNQLKQHLARAKTGERQLVLISGEAGMGKTSLADLFLQEAEKNKSKNKNNEILIARGHCVDQYGHGEAYLPIMDWLYDLAQSAARDTVLSAMRRHAPSWLAQLTMFLDESERESLQRLLPGVTQTRMLQELNHLLIALAETRPVLLLIENLHWSDSSSLELLAYLAQRQEPARWLILGTYRQTEINLQQHRLHDLMAELRSRECCSELTLKPLEADAIATYLRNQLEGIISNETAAYLHQRTGGNALFLINIVTYLLQQELLIRTDDGWQLTIAEGIAEDNMQIVPEKLQQIIIRRFERLPEAAQKLLEVASVAGDKFATAAVAAGLREDLEEVEKLCMQLIRLGSLINELDLLVWPDRTTSGRFQFQHALYRQVIYERLGQAHQARLHQRLAARMEAGYGERVNEIAAELALHFEKGRDIARAIHYNQLAARTAASRHALHEVLTHSQSGLRLLATLPVSAETLQVELDMLILLGTSQIASLGYAHPAVNETYTRAQQLCQQIDDKQRLVFVLIVLRTFHFVRGNIRTASDYAQQMQELARQQQTQLLITAANLSLGGILPFKGELVQARDHLDQAIQAFDLRLRRAYVENIGVDANIACYTNRSRALRLLGYHDQAQRDNDAALNLAHELMNPFSIAMALLFALEHYHARGELEKMTQHIDQALSYSDQYGFSNLAKQMQIYQGWLQAKQGEYSAGTIQLEQTLSALPAAGNTLRMQYYLLLQVDLYRDTQRYLEARQIVEQSLAEMADNAMYIYHSELLRLRGELVLAETPECSAAAERWFHEAIEISRRQQAKTLELRATVSLARLWQAQGKPGQAYQAVKTLYDQFSEGFDTLDLRNAKALLDDAH